MKGMDYILEQPILSGLGFVAEDGQLRDSSFPTPLVRPSLITIALSELADKNTYSGLYKNLNLQIARSPVTSAVSSLLSLLVTSSGSVDT